MNLVLTNALCDNFVNKNYAFCPNILEDNYADVHWKYVTLLSMTLYILLTLFLYHQYWTVEKIAVFATDAYFHKTCDLHNEFVLSNTYVLYNSWWLSWPFIITMWACSLLYLAPPPLPLSNYV